MTDKVPEVLIWIERLGGWAVVLLIVKWMMARIDSLITGFDGALDVFREFQVEEREMHQELVRTQEKIIATQEKILERVKA